jgi:hypothetical protein
MPLKTLRRLSGILTERSINVNNNNNVTFEELKEALKRLDEVTLLELLGLQSDDLVERFDDVIEKKQEYLTKEID